MKGLFLTLATATLLADYTEEVMERYKQEVPPEGQVQCESAASCRSVCFAESHMRRGGDFTVSADFILWTAHMSNSAFAATNDEVLNSPTLDVKTGRVLQPNWSLEPGFRVGIGWSPGCGACDEWQLFARYTWIRFSESTQKPDLSGNLEIVSSLGSPLIETDTSKGHLKHSLNVIDIGIGRAFCLDSCFSIDTRFGLKGQWQDYRFLLQETGESVSTRNSAISKERFTNDTWGIGIRAGITPRWNFWNCFGLYSAFAGTLQWQHFNSKGVVRSQDQDTGFWSNLLDIRDPLWLITPVLESEVGLRFEDWYCCGRYHFVAKLGWEIQWWGRQNQFISFFTQTRDGDLGFQGITASFECDF